MGKIKEQIAAANIDDKMIKRQRAIILSMTPQERRNPDILKASRKKRIAAGSGAKVEDVNRLLKQHRTMADMMKSHGRRQARADGANGADVRPRRRHAAADARTDRRIAEANLAAAPAWARAFRKAPPPGAFPPKPSLPGLPGLPGAKPGLPGLPAACPVLAACRAQSVREEEMSFAPRRVREVRNCRKRGRPFAS